MVQYDRIDQLANEQGVKLASICEKLGKPRAYLTGARRAGTNLKPEQLQVIADALNTTPEYLTGQTDKKEKPPPQGGLADEFIKAFNAASPELQAAVLAVLKAGQQ